MKLLLKHKIYAVLFIVVTFFIFNSNAALNFKEIEKFQKKLTLALTASITVDDNELCPGESALITFEGFDGTPNYTFTYIINGGSEEEISTINDENSVTLTAELTTSGTFTYKLIKVEDGNGTIEDVDEEIVITVTDPPSISFTFTNDGACSNETIDFTSSVTGDGPFSYTWNFGDGSTSTEENPSHTYNSLGIGLQNFSVTLTVTDNNTCTSSVAEIVNVQNTPDISFFSGGSLKNCAAQGDGFEVEFYNSSASSSDITSYTFDWGDGSSETINGADFPANANAILHTYDIGVFTLVISAINSAGCSNEVEFEVIYGNDPGGGLQSPPNTSGICYPTEELGFGIVGWGENSEETIYELDFGDGAIETYTQAILEASSSYNSTDPSMSSVFLTPHIYNTSSCSEPDDEFIVKLTITNACNNKISTANNVVVLEPSVALFDVDPIGCVDVPLRFDNQSIIGDNVDCNENARFRWDWGDGTIQNFPPGSSADDRSHAYSQPGTYTVILSAIGDCGTDTYQKVICIEPEVTASYTLDTEEGCIPLAVAAQNTTDESELCEDSNPTYNWTVTFEDINCNSTSDWEFINDTDANSENPQFLFNNPGNYTVTQKVTTNCGSSSTQKIISVKKPPTVSINPIEDFCQPGQINPTAIIENCTDNLAGVTYNWLFPGGSPSSSSLENPENIAYDTPGVYTITLEVTNECGMTSTTQEFEVLEKPVITNLITTQEICSNQSTIAVPLTSSNPNTTYTWTSTTVPNNTDISGFISSGLTAEIPSQTLINNGNIPGNVVYTVTPILDNCIGDPVDVLTVIVNPTPTIVTQPVDSEVCLDGVANQLTIVTQNGVGVPTYQWYTNTTNSTSGGTPIAGATNSTYDPPTNTVGEIFYYVTIAFQGGCDLITSDVASVVVVQEPVAVANNPLQIVCLDGTPDDFQITLTGGLGNPSYQWYSNTTNSNTGGTLIAGATASTYNPGVLTAISLNYYYVEVTLDGVGCDTAISDVFAVEVVADPVIDTQAIAAQEVCQNASLLDLTITVSGGVTSSTFDYQWYSNTTNNNTGGTPIAGANTNTYTPDNTTIGTLYYYVVVTQTESGCEVISNTSEVTITPGPTIVTQPVDSEVCLDGVANQLTIVTQNGVGVPTYQWYTNTTNSTSGGTPIAGATNSTYDPPTNTVGEIFYYVTIAFQGGCDLITSDVASVVVVQEPVAVANNPLQIVCLDGTPDDFQITLTGGLGNPSYQWYSNTTNSNTGGTLIAGATASTYNPGVLTAISLNYYYVEVTLDGVGCDTAISDVFAVEVVADPVIDTQAIAAQEVCQNASLLDLTITVSGGVTSSTFDYQWYSNTTNNNTGGTPIAGANTNTYTPDNTTIGTLYYYVVVTQTESGCEVISNTSEVTITPGPTIVTQPVDSEVCLDGVANQLTIVTQNGVGVPTYQWYTNTTNSTSGGTPIAGATNSTYDPPTNTVGEIFYYVTIAFQGGCDLITSDVASVVVVQEPVAVANNPLQIVCLDGTPDDFQITLTGGLGNPSYQWYSNTTNSNTGGTLIAGATASTYNPGVLTAISLNYYYVEVTLDGVGCDTAISDVFAVEVVADPVIDTQAIAAQEVCQNASLLDLTITVSGGVTSSTFDYQWYSNTTNNNTGGTPIAGANTNTYTPDNTTIGTLYYYVVVTQTESGCEVISNTSEVTITPGPTIVTQPVDSEVCLDGVANQLTIVTQNGVGVPTYQWYTNTTNSTSGGTPIAGATNSTYDPPTNTVGEIFYYVTIAFQGGCDLITSDVASVVVVQEPVAVANNPLQIVCLDGTPDDFQITLTGGLGNPSYQWYSNTTNSNTGGTLIAGATASTYNPGVLTAISLNYYYVEVTLDGVGCDTAISDVFAVEVVADPVIDTQAIAAQEVCQNASLLDLTITVSGGVTSSTFDYQWYSNTTNNNTGGTPIAGANTNTYTPDNTTIGTLYYYVVVTQTESGCEVISNTSEVTITPGPTIVTQPVDSEVCLDGVANQLTIVTQNGVGVPTYQWYTNTTNSTSGGTPIAGATNSTYDPPTNTVGEIFYYVTIAFQGGCDLITSDVASVVVVQEPVAVANNPLQIVCLDGTPDDFQITLTGGLGNPSYQWYSNTTNSNTGGTLIAGATASTYNPGVLTAISLNYYYVEVTLDGVGCDTAISDVFAVEVVADPVIDTQAIAAQEVCQNASLLDLTITVSGGVTSSTFDYQWYSNTTNNNTGGTPIAGANTNTYTPDNTTIGTLYYYVVVTQTESGCEVISNTSEVTITPGPTIVTQPVDSEVCLDGVANQLTIVTQNGVGVPTYQWYTNTTNSTSGGTPIAGATNSTYDPPTNTVGEIFYYVTIAFQGGCDLITSDVASVVVVQEPVAVANNPLQIVCLDGTPDDFQITLTGGLGNPSYQWYSNTTNSNTGGTLIAGATASTYNPGVLTAISLNYYYVEVTLDGVGCDTAISDVFAVEVVADPVIDTQAIAAQEVCQNASLLDLTITVSGGVTSSTFDYQWYSNTTNNNTGGTPIAGANTNTYTPDNTTIGTLYYYVVVTQTESGCEVISNTSEVTITPGPTIVTQPVDSEVCLDGVANQLTIVTQNGVGVPTYQWYTNTTNSTSGGTPIAGATNSTYDPPTNTVGEIFYYVTIAFQGGCDLITSDVASVVVNEIPVIDTAEITIYSEETFLFDPSSVAGNIVPTGTTYTWSSPTSSNPGDILGSSSESSPQTNISQTLENISSPPEPVTETYVITPATPSCTGQPFILIVTVNPSIISNVEITNNSCFESNNGILSTNITGGVPFTSGPPYLISWTGPNSFTSTSSTITNLLAGDYTLRIEDSNGVFVIEQYTVSQPDVLTITTDVEKNISCFDGNDGAIEVSINGGTAPYTYNWTGDGVVQGSPSQSGLTAGTYSLEVVDDKQCVINQTYTLTEPDIIVINTVSKNDILCFGDATGAIEINITGGTPTEVSPGIFEYGYSWTGPNGFTSNAQNISNLLAGTYTIEVTDELGCKEQTDIELTQPPAIEINYTKTDVSCYGEADGSIDISVNGGNPPYQISWSNLGNGFSQSNLSAGNYIAKIVDQNLCEANVTITIEQPIFFIAPIVSPISCNDANDASIDLNLTGGIAPITVLWSDDPSAGIQRNNLSPGSYTVSIIDSDTDQCPIEETFIITNPPELAVTSIVNDAIDCDVSNSGSIELDVSGGTQPYTFLWNTGQTSEDIFNIPSGDYSVEIKDSRGCTINREYTIFRQEPILISLEETVIPDCNSNTINVQNIPNVTGGFLPYTYSWSSGVISGSNNEIMTTNQSGAYVLTVTDGRGCQESVSIQVDVPEVGFPEFTYESLSLTQYSYVSIEDPIQFFNLSTGNFTNVSWDFGDGSPIINTLNPEHTYDQVGTFTVTLTVEYDYGCTYQITQDINVTKGYLLVIPNAFSPNEDGINDVVRPSFRGFTTIRMLVYDTWGTLVYEEEGTSLEGWNGFINEKPAENGNYIMYVNGITFFGQEIKKSTSITILK